MICPRCKNDVPDAPFCCQCGRALERRQNPKRRGNGQGTVVKRGDKWRAVVTLGYYMDDSGKLHRKTKSQSFDKKSDAVSALVTLRDAKTAPPSITLRELFARWEPTHRAGDSTMGCYRAAFKYVEPLWAYKLSDITIDDLQTLMDECERSRRTKENLRAVLGLMYKYAVPRHLAEMNLAQYLTIDAESAKHRPGFTLDEVAKIRKAVGRVENAEIILCMIYLGFRPSEFLALTGASYDRERGYIVGGAKTEAGKNRIVPVSPKIVQYIPHGAADAPLFGFDMPLKKFTEEVFYPALTACGVQNPIVEVGGGVKRHKYTPHSCRHTFATLMKNVPGADRDKMELIGHASGEMLRYYQDVGIEDLRKIIEQL